MDSGADQARSADEIWVRQCTSCGRADLREWFPSRDAIARGQAWQCQLCERSAWRARELREMLEGRIPSITST